MSINLILHGGATSTNSPDNDKFFSYFTSLVDKNEIKIMMCYFAREENRWNTLLERDTPKVMKNTGKKVEFHIPKNPKDLLDKLDDYDVLYVAGGTAKPIEALYPDLEELRDKLEGKIYLGSSMGAFMVSSNYVLSVDEQDTLSVHKGLGLLPINCLVHWDVEPNKDKKIEMIKSSSDLPLMTLDECESVRFVI